MNTSMEPFGNIPSGEQATLFRIALPKGMEADFTDFGGRVVSLRVPDKNGRLTDIVSGYDEVAGYVSGKRYFGSNPGPYANRIKRASYTIDGKKYELEANEGPNQLHGGKIGFDQRFWEHEPTENGIRFFTHIPDGEAGRPGNLKVWTEYGFPEKNTFTVRFLAETDAPTHVNITHHGYFNLNGHAGAPVLNHEMFIAADAILENDREKIPTGRFIPVLSTPFDLRKSGILETHIRALNEDFDHCYVLSDMGGPAAAAYSPHTGIEMRLYTDYPGLQFYCSGKPGGNLPGKGGVLYPAYSSFCLEPQFFPDSPNREEFPPTLLRPGERYDKQITFTFTVK